MTPTLIRFLAKVSLGDGCWEWRGYRGPHGYGYMSRDGKPGPAHRFAYEHFVGPIPEGLHLDHLCRNRGCVNPEHLEPVTPHENALRGEWATRTHCAAGHEYTPENLYRHTNGSRRCKECKRRHDTNHHAKRRAMRAPEFRPRPAIVHLCRRCAVTEHDVETGRVIVSPKGTAHQADLGGTRCGWDATGEWWWWPA